MPKIRPEKVAGIVALSYLALIPAGGILTYLKLRQMDEDVNTMWAHLGMDPERAYVGPIDRVKNILRL